MISRPCPVVAARYGRDSPGVADRRRGTPYPTKENGPTGLEIRSSHQRENGMIMSQIQFKPPACSVCGRPRSASGMDAYEYSPIQVISNQPFGWYSDDDAEICPEDMTKMIRGQ